jgi:hypothetical protein
MKYIILLVSFGFLLLLGSCAKVSYADGACTKPSRPIMRDTFYSGNSYYGMPLTAQRGPNTNLIWINPSGQTVVGVNITIDPNSGYNGYGQYKVVAFNDNCFSDTTIFNVNQYQIGFGAPTCSGYNSNALSYNTGYWLNSLGGGSYSSGGGYSNNQIITGDGFGSDVTISFPPTVTPTPGHYYMLTGNYNLPGGASAFVGITTGFGGSSYNSVSGNLYITTIGGLKYVVLCNANFTGSNGSFTTTGSFSYY